MIGLVADLLAVGLLVGAMLLTGRGMAPWLDRADQSRVHRWLVRGIAGLLAWHLTLMICDLADIGWNRGLLFALGLLLPAASHAAGRLAASFPKVGATFRQEAIPKVAANPASLAEGDAPKVGATFRQEAIPKVGATSQRRGLQRLPWGDWVATVVVLGIAALAWWGAILFPDFVYHWGIKGARYQAVGGIDTAFLTRPWNYYLHPGYPHLLPSLFASTGLIRGVFRVPAMMLWTPLFFAGLLVAARQLLIAARCTRTGRSLTLALLAIAVAGFTLHGSMAGSADWLPSLALLVGWAAMMPSKGDSVSSLAAGDLQLGLAAALAASGKLEGMPMAAFLVAAHLVQRGFLHRRTAWAKRAGMLLRSALPTALVAAPWAILALRFDLLAAEQRGPLTLADSAIVLTGLVQQLSSPAWNGLAWLIVLLPLLALPTAGRSLATRPLAAVVALQLLFFLYAYHSTPLTGNVEELRFATTSFPRLLFHLLPAVLVGLSIRLDRWATPDRTGQPLS